MGRTSTNGFKNFALIEFVVAKRKNKLKIITKFPTFLRRDGDGKNICRNMGLEQATNI